MKKLLFFGLLLSVFRGQGQGPGWSVSPSGWQHSMSVRAELWLDGAPSSAAGAVVAAFSGGQLRGASTAQAGPGGSVWQFLTVYSNQFSGEEVTFRAYFPGLGERKVSQRASFLKNAALGLGAQPLRLDARTDDDFPPALLDFPLSESVSPAGFDTLFLPDFLQSFDGDPVSWSAVATPNLAASIVGGNKLAVRRANAAWSGSAAVLVTATETGTGQQHSATKSASFLAHPAPGAPNLTGAVPPQQRWAWPGSPFPAGQLSAYLAFPQPPCAAYSVRLLPPSGSAAAPDWAAPPPGGNSMSVVARADFGGQPYEGAGLQMAAFVGGQLAATALATDAAGQKLFFLSLANVGAGPITLKLHDPARQSVHERTTAVAFAPQGSAGSALSPLTIECAPLSLSISPSSGAWSAVALDPDWTGELTARFFAASCDDAQKRDSLDAVFLKTACEPGLLYADNDLDGRGAGAAVGFGCTAPAGQSRLSGDCADNDAARFPGNPEICDGKDNDCLGGVPFGEADADADGQRGCAGDCDDADAARFLGNAETCDGKDNDCDGLADLADPDFADLAPPTALCRSVTVSLSGGFASASAAQIDNGSFDACSPTVALSIAAGTTAYNCGNAAQSPFTVSLRATDASGNTATCSAQVSVSDALSYAQSGRRSGSDGLAGDKFGWSAALEGSLAAAGALEAKVGAQNKQGAAYVFAKDLGGAGAWGQSKKIWAADGAAIDYFGSALALDGPLLLAAAYGDNIGAATDRGSAYLFSKDLGGTNNWGQAKQVMASDGQAYDYFGSSAALKGGFALVGASKAKVGAATAQGAAYVFSKDLGGANNWGQAKKLSASDGAANHYFGAAAALSETGALALVGANGNSGNRGAGYLFAKDLGGANNWGQAKKLSAADAASGDGLGASAALAGNFALLGAPNKGGYKGAAYLFQKDLGGADNWGEAKKLTAADGAANDRFGASVALSGDYAYVGAILAGGKGAVYVFQKDNGGAGNWGQTGKYIAADGAANDQYGFSMAASGAAMAVGANLDDVAGKADQGSLYFLAGAPSCPGSLGSGAGQRAAKTAAAIELRCSPSPFQDELSIEAAASGPAQLTVTDAAGRAMASVDLPAGPVKFDLKTSEFRPGIYFVKISAADGIKTVPVALVR